MASSLPNLAIAHLVLRLRPLGRALRAAAARRVAMTERLAGAGAAADHVTPGHVGALLDDLEDLTHHSSFSVGKPPVTEDEDGFERTLRERAADADAGMRLPLDALANDLGLDPFELEAIVICAAADLDGAYERIFGFVLDDASRRLPSVELIAGLTASSLYERLTRRAALGAFGRLRRLGILVAVPASQDGGGLRQELRLSPAALHFLLGNGTTDAALLFRDPADVPVPAEDAATALGLARPAHFERIADGFRRGELATVGVWGTGRSGTTEVVLALAAASGRALRRFIAGDAASARQALETAAALDAVLWVDSDLAADPGAGTGHARSALVEGLAASSVPAILSGATPWRPTALLAARPFAELLVPEPTSAARRGWWCAALPELNERAAAELATRYRFGPSEIRAGARLARSSARVYTNGHVSTPAGCVADACAAVARHGSLRHARLILPRRRPDELVLPPELHARVLDIAAFHRARAVVDEEWGFARATTGGGGVKALFTGDSGTGKTLAAEIVAGVLGLPLLEIDLARVVSKWVGETEKNLDVAFREAEDSHAVLFFDEAEALFGSRGEVRHGTDRYANLEVSYLLQRLDNFGGVVILASNLRDKIDPAFTRRFHVVVGFPRPQEKERRRLWQQAFPEDAPVGANLDLQTLARLDLTGASIVAAARTAAMLAATSDSPEITMCHVVRAVARQFQREARILNPSDLGTHAMHLDGAA